MEMLNVGSRDREIITAAAFQLRDLGVSLDVTPHPAGDPATRSPHDGIATLSVDGRKLVLPVEIKRGLRPSTVGLVSEQIDGGLLLGDHITSAVGDLLRARRIQYVDSVGNASIRGSGIIIEVRGRRVPTAQSATGSEASPLFTRAGLPVVLALLNEPDLLEAPLREVQARTTVSLGSVQKVMSFLRDRGRPLAADPSDGAWRRLYDGWVAAYLAGPRDKALIGRYSSDRRPRELVQLLGDVAATPSGEGAAHLAGYDIMPSSFDLYVHDSVGPVIREARLRPDPAGPVSLRHPTWTVQAEQRARRGASGERLAPTPVVYADLLAQEDPRTNAVAKEWRTA